VFIDANMNDVVEGRPLGVEPICSLLQVAPRVYNAAKDRARWRGRSATRPSPRNW
jgi:putative transposase